MMCYDSDSQDCKKLKEMEKKHRCTFPNCNSTFNRPWKLVRHSYKHTQERPYKCHFSDCTKDYRSKSHLQRHISLSHSEKKESLCFLSCPYPNCLKVFCNKYSLKKHLKIHSETNPYKCQFCEYSSRKRHRLMSHSSIHTGEYNFKCEMCEAQFLTNRNLAQHKKTHLLKNCHYEDCNSVFSTWSALRKHMKKIHFIAYKCNECQKEFINKNTLAVHVLSHLPKEGRLVFSCTFKNCKRFYFYKKNLQQHIKSYHEERRHLCNVNSCGKTFASKQKLQIHLAAHDSTPVPKKKINLCRAVRRDKGLPKKSMAAKLSGILLPPSTDKALAQEMVTEVIEQVVRETTNKLLKADVFLESAKCS